MLSGNAPKLQALVEGDLTRVSPATMATAAADGEAAIDGVLQRAAEWLGIAAANVVTTFHPELIVLGGGVSALGERLARPVQEIIHRRVGMFPATDVRVKCSALGDEAGLYGGLALAFKGGYKNL
jgi:glucokinase